VRSKELMIQVSVMPSTTDEDGGAMHSKAKAARISSGGNQGRSSQSSVSPLASQSSEHTLESFKAEIESASISAICHAALVKSPAAARAAYSKHNNSIEPELAKTFEIVGSYEDEVVPAWIFSNLLHSIIFFLLLFKPRL